MRARIAVVGAGALLIVLMVAFPPYFVTDTRSEGRVHASIGYHPLWNPPTPEFGCARLYPGGAAAQPAPGTPPRRVDACVIRLNTVSLAMQGVVVVLLVAIGLAATRRRAA